MITQEYIQYSAFLTQIIQVMDWECAKGTEYRNFLINLQKDLTQRSLEID